MNGVAGIQPGRDVLYLYVPMAESRAKMHLCLYRICGNLIWNFRCQKGLKQLKPLHHGGFQALT